mgnify:CR=1 FL=1
MKYSNELAMACFVAGNVAAMIRGYLEAGNHGVIVSAWIDLDNDDEKSALASLRSNLSREAKKLYGHGLKVDVKAGKLVAVKPRNRKAKEKSPLIALAEKLDGSGDAAKIEIAIKALNDLLVK